jgi:hypothetical protein
VHIPSCMDTVENRLPLSAPSTLCSLSALAFAQFLAALRPCSPGLSSMSRDLPSIMSSVCAVSPSTRASFHEQCTPPTMKRTEARHHFIHHWALHENWSSVPHLYESSTVANNNQATLLTTIRHRPATCHLGEPPSSELLRLDLPQLSRSPAGATYPPHRRPPPESSSCPPPPPRHGEIFPCLLCLWAKRPRWAEPLLWRLGQASIEVARLNCAISVFPLGLIQIKFKPLKFRGTWIYSIKL